MICKGCCSALLTQQALDKPQPDKFRVIKQKWNSLLFHINKKEIPKHINVVPLNSITIFFYSQAGKHRLFLNILLFGKLHSPNLKLSVELQKSCLPIPLEKVLNLVWIFLFVFPRPLLILLLPLSYIMRCFLAIKCLLHAYNKPAKNVLHTLKLSILKSSKQYSTSMQYRL